jgi:hypothetical protein
MSRCQLAATLQSDSCRAAVNGLDRLPVENMAAGRMHALTP